MLRRAHPNSAELPIPTLGVGENPVNSRAGFEEGEIFPPPGWELSILSDNVCRPDTAAALTGSRGLLCQDLLSLQGTI